MASEELDAETTNLLLGDEGEATLAPAKLKATRGSRAAGVVPRIKIMVEENDSIPPTGLFISHNGVACVIRPGEVVEVPQGIVEILEHAVMSAPVVDPDTKKVVDYRDRLRYPFRRL